MTNVLLSPEAERHLEEIGDYIAADNPARAVSFVPEIGDRCTKIGNAPLACAARPETRGTPLPDLLSGRTI